VRNLVIVLGDQLDRQSAALDGFDRRHDVVWMAEVSGEATHVWSHKARIALFVAAMRHFRDEQVRQGRRLEYRALDDRGNRGSFADELAVVVRRLKPRRLIMVTPGEWRVKQALHETVVELDLPLEVRPDRHFLCSPEEFTEHARGRKQLRLEYFYRQMRRKADVLMDADQPAGGKWNLDPENRESLPKSGPEDLPRPLAFPPDATTREVLDLVERRFGSHPGSLDHFDWPVTPADARQALDDFIQHRLPDFGRYQDAMCSDEPFLYHSLLSSAMNLKLLDPREAIEAAEAAYRAGGAPLNSVEGFIRQILGWREYVRGVYWRFMPEYLDRNALEADLPLPSFYWTGDIEMNCLRQAIGQTLQYGYAHHIQRLMVTGLFALLLGVDPREVHRWYLAVYVDAVEWAELPNTLGMSQFADGGVMASKPYSASGNYIQRMSNYCTNCRFDPKKPTADDTCPFTSLYWDFLARHHNRLADNRRMTMQLKNLQRKSRDELRTIRRQADTVREVCLRATR